LGEGIAGRWEVAEDGYEEQLSSLRSQLEYWNDGMMEYWVLSGIVQSAEGRE